MTGRLGNPVSEIWTSIFARFIPLNHVLTIPMNSIKSLFTCLMLEAAED